MSSYPQKNMSVEKAIELQDIAAFRTALTSCSDINARLEVYPRDTYLALACGIDGAHEIVRELLQAKADPRIKNNEKKAPIHIAAETCNSRALEYLLKDPRTDVNYLDGYGNTALHSLCRGRAQPAERAKECLMLLLNQPDIKVNKQTHKLETAVFLAAKEKHRHIVEQIVKRPNVDLDTNKCDGQTARDLISMNFKDIQLQPECMIKNTEYDEGTLFQIMASKNIQAFEDSLNKFLETGNDEAKNKILNASDGQWTFLQYASIHGLTNFVKLLLEKGADPNINPTGNELPLILAATFGQYEVFELLLPKTDCKACPTVLHALIGSSKSNSNRDDLRNCFQLLLQHNDIDVNAVNSCGNTALHVADGEEYFVTELIAHGASVAIKNKFDMLPLENMTSNTLEKCLDARLKHKNTESSGIIFDYRFLDPDAGKSQNILYSTNSNYVAIPINYTGSNCNTDDFMVETDVLLYMSSCKRLRHLLKHPVFTSYIQLKWRGARQLYMINLVCYVIFVLSLTAYLLLGYAYAPTSIRNSGNDSNSSQHAQETITDRIALYTEAPLWWIILILSMCLILRELTQAVVSFRRYFSYSENYIELLLILFTALILFYESAEAEVRPHLSSITIFLCWTEFVLLTGRHPRQSTNIEMLKVVSKSFLMYLSWFFIIIVAFAIVFYILFVSDDSFRNPAQSLFKTMIMVTGEFDLGDVEMTYPVTSHVLFILFMFFVAIVLLNLLNGLAVSDTQAIKSDAELFAIVSRVKLISNTERLLLGRPIWNRHGSGWKLSNISCVNRFIKQKLLLFPETLPEKSVLAFKTGNTVKVTSDTNYDPMCPLEKNSCTVDSDILTEAEYILWKIKLSEIEENKSIVNKKIDLILDILDKYLIKKAVPASDA